MATKVAALPYRKDEGLANALLRGDSRNRRRTFGMPSENEEQMAYFAADKIAVNKEAAKYEDLDYLLGCYLHQNLDIAGKTLPEIIAAFRAAESKQLSAAVATDIGRFLSRYEEDDKTLSTSLRPIFEPGVIVEGWEGLNTRQWLNEVVRLLASFSQSVNC